jgi:hypothetical protein
MKYEIILVGNSPSLTIATVQKRIRKKEAFYPLFSLKATPLKDTSAGLLFLLDGLLSQRKVNVN